MTNAQSHPPAETVSRIPAPFLLAASIGAAGFSAIVTQLVFMREMLNVFDGNEMVLGIVLGNWMLLMGLGAALGRSVARRAGVFLFGITQILQAVLPLAGVFLLRAARHVFFARGEALGIAETATVCFAALLPFCLSAGLFLAVATCVMEAAKDPGGKAETCIGRVYWLDSLGGVFGGAAFTFVMIHFLNHFSILQVVSFANLFCALAIAWNTGQRGLLAGAAVITLGEILVVGCADLDRISTRIEFAGRQVIFRGHSPYGELVVTRHSDEYHFIQNGVPFFSTHNVEQVEETVHYAMAQWRAGGRRNVLLIGGGATGAAREILKYPEARVDYVELDPLILEAAGQYVPERLADSRIRILHGDGRLRVKTSHHCYDVILVNVPEPMTFQLNRYYTREFYQEAQRAMTPGGVLAFALGRYENYLGKELSAMIATAHRTLRSVFAQVTLIPGGRVFFLASDSELTEDIAARMEENGIPTRLVNRHYLRGVLTADRFAEVRRAALLDQAGVNRDFNPILCYDHLRHWMSRFRVQTGVLQALLGIVLFFYLLRMRPVSFVVFTAGFAASVMEVVLLLGCQILYGSVYQKAGWVVALFMGGLSFGGLVMNRFLQRRTAADLTKLLLCLAVCAAVTPPVLMAIGHVRQPAVAWFLEWLMFPVMVLLPAGLVGMFFPLAGKLDFRGATVTAAMLYAADYVGAALGMFLASALLIPLIGITAACLLTAILCLASSLAAVPRHRAG
ncbi:MAG: fused MFS/spermidine synthase [Verrucomicrobia bacterium]|nr:fused MFS/spermidine synthase [Verrucomicrobiota bacterium]